jgi:Cu2+-exporting ATPase
LLPIWGVIPATAFLYSHPQYKTTVAGSVAVLSSLNLASQKGILIKDGRTLELLNQIDTVVFDKTGTLTKEQPQVAVIHTSHGSSQLEVLRLAAAAEYKQSHPIARAILEEASSYQLEVPDICESEYKVGYGISVTLNDQVVRVGSVRFMTTCELTMAPEMRQVEARCHREGHTLVLVGLDHQVVGGIELHASTRPEAKALIRGLRERGITQLYIISGDHEGPTKKLAQELGIDHYFAETLPEQKASLIDQLHREGKSVCYVGDGINDSIALKKANVSVSLRGASSVATDTAQVVLMDESLNELCSLFDLAKEFDSNMRKTFAIVFVPHALALLGSLFLHFDFISVFFLTQASLYSGVANALSPLMRHRMEQDSLITSHDSSLTAHGGCVGAIDGHAGGGDGGAGLCEDAFGAI